MMFNEHLDRLMELDVVQNFMKTHRMKGMMCSEETNHCFILYRFPYVIGFWDAPIENYLEIVLVDLETRLLIEGGPLLACSLSLDLQSLDEMRQKNFDQYPEKNLFSSFGERKVGDLYVVTEAIDKLLPLIECKGGLISMKDDSFDPRFNFSDSVKPIYPGLKERYQKCIGSS